MRKGKASRKLTALKQDSDNDYHWGKDSSECMPLKYQDGWRLSSDELVRQYIITIYTERPVPIAKEEER